MEDGESLRVVLPYNDVGKVDRLSSIELEIEICLPHLAKVVSVIDSLCCRFHQLSLCKFAVSSLNLNCCIYFGRVFGNIDRDVLFSLCVGFLWDLAR